MIAAFLWGLLAASSLVLGALVVTIHRPGKRSLGVVMAFGAGVLLSAVAFELVLPAVESSAVGTLVGFLAGTARVHCRRHSDQPLGLCQPQGHQRCTRRRVRHDDRARRAAGRCPRDGGTRADAVADRRDRRSGVGRRLRVERARGNRCDLQLARRGWSTSRTYVLWVSIALISAVASALGYTFLDGASVHVIAFMYAFAGGAILTMLSTSMMPEAYENVGRLAGVATVLGGTLAFTITWIQGI